MIILTERENRDGKQKLQFCRMPFSVHSRTSLLHNKCELASICFLAESEVFCWCLGWFNICDKSSVGGREEGKNYHRAHAEKHDWLSLLRIQSRISAFALVPGALRHHTSVAKFYSTKKFSHLKIKLNLIATVKL